MALVVGFPNMLSSILRNANKIFESSASFTRFYRNGGSPTPFMAIENAQGLHLSSISLVVENPPKMPLTPFFRFLKKRRQDLLKAQPDLKQREIVRQAAIDWKTLTSEYKKPYEDVYKAELTNFKVVKEQWTNSLTNEQKVELQNLRDETKKAKAHRLLRKQWRLLGKPKRPCNPFNYYIIQMDKSSIKHGQTMLSKAVEEWNAMSNTAKQPYVTLASKDKVRYEKEIEKWEQKMKNEGKLDIIRERSKEAEVTIKKAKVKLAEENLKTTIGKLATPTTGKTKPGIIKKPSIRS